LPGFGGLAADAFLDGIELGDPAQVWVPKISVI
jgi:hypothetical protein